MTPLDVPDPGEKVPAETRKAEQNPANPNIRVYDELPGAPTPEAEKEVAQQVVQTRAQMFDLSGWIKRLTGGRGSPDIRPLETATQRNENGVAMRLKWVQMRRELTKSANAPDEQIRGLTAENRAQAVKDLIENREVIAMYLITQQIARHGRFKDSSTTGADAFTENIIYDARTRTIIAIPYPPRNIHGRMTNIPGFSFRVEDAIAWLKTADRIDKTIARRYLEDTETTHGRNLGSTGPQYGPNSVETPADRKKIKQTALRMARNGK